MQRRILGVCVSIVLFVLLFFNTGAFAGHYKVKKGDTLYTIAKHQGVSVAAIKKANHLSSNKLKLGQMLDIKNNRPDSPVFVKSKSQTASTYRIKKGDTLSIISKKTGTPIKQIAALNNVNSKNLRVGRTLILSKETPSAPPQTLAKEEDDAIEEDDGEADSSDITNSIVSEAKSSEEFLGKWGSADERKLFVKVATGFLGAPYRFGGATIKGIDCSGFVRKMYGLFDISLPRTAHEQSTVGVRIDRNKLEEGDLVFFRTRKPIGHVGIYIGNNEFLHASYRSKAVRIDNLDSPYFQKRFQRAVRVKDLDENDGT